VQSGLRKFGPVIIRAACELQLAHEHAAVNAQKNPRLAPRV
jgi:hypothetical protein